MENEPITKHKKQEMIGVPPFLKEKFDIRMREEGYKIRSKYLEYLLNK